MGFDFTYLEITIFYCLVWSMKIWRSIEILCNIKSGFILFWIRQKWHSLLFHLFPLGYLYTSNKCLLKMFCILSNRLPWTISPEWYPTQSISFDIFYFNCCFCLTYNKKGTHRFLIIYNCKTLFIISKHNRMVITLYKLFQICGIFLFRFFTFRENCICIEIWNGRQREI